MERNAALGKGASGFEAVGMKNNTDHPHTWRIRSFLAAAAFTLVLAMSGFAQDTSSERAGLTRLDRVSANHLLPYATEHATP